jgi:hypothetical protein
MLRNQWPAWTGIRTALPLDGIQGQILLVRGQKVLLDSTLATLYGVETRRLNEQVRRNRERFPEDFLIELTAAECDDERVRYVPLDVFHASHVRDFDLPYRR